MVDHLDTCLAHIGGTLAKFAIDPGPKGKGPVPVGAVGFHQANLYQTLQHTSSRSLRSLDRQREIAKPKAALSAKAGKHDQGVQGQRFPTALFFCEDNPQEIKIGLPAKEFDDHGGSGGSAVVRSGPTEAQEALVDAIYSTARPFRQANALEGIGENRVAWGRIHGQ